MIEFKIISDYRLVNRGDGGGSLVSAIQNHLDAGYELHGHIFLTNPTANRGVQPVFGQVVVKYEASLPRIFLERVAKHVFREDQHPREPISEMSDTRLIAEIGGHPTLQDFETLSLN